MTREQLIEAIADVSHKTYVRQAAIAKQTYRSRFDPTTGAADRARASDIVERLEQLGIKPDAENRPSTTREQLIDELAVVSHGSWVRDKEAGEGIERFYRKLPAQTADHDLERAEDVVERLDELGVVSWDSCTGTNPKPSSR
jgi:hypothetical protein